MSSSFDYLDLCRLCLVKDRVTVPIFEAEGDVRQIFLKITACLPVKVSRDDKLPKKICDDCVYKVETFYQFWNTTANAEKQLLQWLCEVGGLEDKQGYEVLDSNVMKQEQGTDSRLDGNVMQVGGHQNNMDMGMMDNMSLITMSTGSEQQFTSVPMDASGTVQAVPGPSTQTHEVAQSQTGVSHIVEEEEESEEDENSDEGCDNEEGLPVKEETEEGQSDQTLEPTQFVSLPCDEAGPSGLQQQKMAEMSEMTMQQTADGDPKTGLDFRDYARTPQSRGNWTENDMASALQQLLDNRMSLREASKTYNISLNSLKSRYRTAYKRRVSREPKILFEKGLHAQLVFHVEDHRARCLPFSHNDFCRFAFEVAEYLSLVDRYPHVFNKMTRMMNDKYYLTFRNSQNAAFTAIAGNGIDAFFEKYRQLIREFSIKPIKIISCTVVSVGMQVVEGENPRKLSVMLSIDAVGTSRIPPAFICSKNERPFQKFLYQDIPVGSLFFVNDTGDFCSETLLKWLEVVVQKIEPTRERPMILLIDSYVYPRNLALTQYTGRHHIRVLGLPASILNPFYQEPARPYREAYECACLTWLLGQRVTNFNDDRSFAVEAFSCAGLWPIPEGTEKKLCEAVSDREHENPKTGNKE